MWIPKRLLTVNELQRFIQQAAGVILLSASLMLYPATNPSDASTLDLDGLTIAPPSFKVPAFDRFAEDLYDELVQGTGDEIRVEFEDVDRGDLSELTGRPLRELLPVPNHRVTASLFGTTIHDFQFLDAPNAPIAPEFDATLQRFEDVHYPISLGSYRRLNVVLTIDGTRKSHQILEFCWPELDRCRILDPVLLDAQSMAETRLRLSAEHWRPKLEVERVEPTKTIPEAATVKPAPETPSCHFADNKNWRSASLRWEPWSIEYKNIFGDVDLRKTFGDQSVGVRCEGDSEATCKAVFFGESQTSACESKNEAYLCSPCEGGFLPAEGSATTQVNCPHRLQKRQSVVETEGSDQNLAKPSTPIERLDRSGGRLAAACVWG